MGGSKLFWQMLLAFAAISLISDLGLWLLALRFDRGNVSFWLALGFVGMLPLSAAFLIVWKTIRPLETLNRRAQRLAGEWGPHLTSMALRRDEVWQLSEAFEQIQKRLEERVSQLQLYSQRLSTVLESMVEGVLAVDPEERVLFANDASLALLEIPVRDVIGRPLLTLTRILAIQEIVAQAAQQRAPQEAEVHSTGLNRRLLALRATPLPGTPCPGVVVVLHDVTNLRRLESMRRDFVTNVSHELKTPLAAIKAYAETLRLGAVHDPQHNLEFVGRIEEQADRLHQLILDLLQLARVESGRESFEFSDVALQDIVHSCVEGHQSLAVGKRLALQLEPPEGEVLVRADLRGLCTILDNLLGNAINYTPAGGRIVVRWKAEGDFARLEVEDTGVGIAAPHQERIFERFYRVDRARSRELGGTGLGLAIVKHLVQAFGGTVEVTSEVGRGSTFAIRLPRAPAESNAARAQPQVSERR